LLRANEPDLAGIDDALAEQAFRRRGVIPFDEAL
jgi:hypothetical protein